MRASHVALLLLLLLAVPALLFLWPGQDRDGSGEGAGAPAATAAEDEARAAPVAAGAAEAPAAAGAPAAPIETAGRQTEGLVVRVLGPAGRPAGDVLFLLAEGDDEPRRLERPDGRLVLPRAGGAFRVSARAGGAWSPPREVSAAERRGAQEILLRAELAAATLVLRVTGPDGRPAAFTGEASWTPAPAGPGGPLLLRRSEPRPLAGAGELVLDGLQPGMWFLRLEAEGCVPRPTQVELPPGRRETLAVTLVAGGRVAGRVTDEAGGGLAEATVALVPENLSRVLTFVPAGKIGELAPPGGRGRTGSDGSFLLGPVAPGRYLIRAEAPGRLAGGPAQPIEVRAGTTAEAGSFPLAAARGLRLIVVRSEDDEAVAGARVRWIVGGADESFLSSLVPWNEADARTGADGRLDLAEAPLGRLTLQVDAAGFGSRVVEVPADFPRERLFRVELEPGLELRGRVLDAATAQPVADAVVRAVPPAAGLASLLGGLDPGGRMASTRSDEQGRFRLDGLAAGTWTLAAEHEDYAPGRSDPIELAAGRPAGEVEIRLGRGATLTVRVLGDDGAPRPDTLVTLTGMDGSTRPDAGQTDAAGEVVFAHLPPAGYQVQAIATDLADLAGMAGGELAGLRTVAGFVELEEGEEAELVLGGRTETCTVQGYLVCGDEPAADLSVMLVSPAGTRVATADEVGFYRFEQVRSGDYLLMVGRIGLGSGAGYTEGFHVSGTGILQHDVELPLTRVEVEVRRSGDDEPLRGVAVLLRREDGVQGGGFELTDADGLAVFRYLPAGRYVASVGRAAMPIFGGGGEYGSRVLETIDLRPGPPVRLVVRLEPAARARVRVLDSSGTPVAGAGVFVLDDHGRPLTLFTMKTTGGDGVVELGSLPAGRVRLLARHPRFGQVEQEAWLEAGRTTEADLVLEPGCLLRIRILDENGEPRPGIQAICLDRRGTPHSLMMMGADAMSAGLSFLGGGEQRVGPLAPGPYRVILSDLGGRMVEHEVVVEPGVPELRLDLPFPD
ncbi:MAG: carboxypeptidase regulatory-like domain-containing protein [Planctomycetota bacterium]|nr:MAG: carboxypeptidase regulatory-like domain-containing protein [Planctomycetota bacterium]